MADQWSCSQCGRINSNTMRFCPDCGAANPAVETASGTVGPTTGNRRLMWTAIIGVWVIGFAVLAVGGGMWLARRDQPAVSSPVAVATTAMTVPATPAEPTPTASDTPMPTNTPQATDTPGAEPQDHESDGDSLAVAGDVLALPTTVPEGIILFLSSRDHDPEKPSGPTGPGQNRRVELYAMQPDGSQQTRLSDGSQEWGNTFPGLTTYPAANQIVINGRYVYDLTTGQMVEELAWEFPDSGPTGTFQGQNPVWSSEETAFFYGAKSNERLSIYYLEAGADTPAKLTDPPADVWGDAWPDLSPDEAWLVFFRNWYDPAQDGLWLMRPDGSDEQRIIPGGEGTPHRGFWSPDGTQIAYEGPKPNSDRFNFEVWLADADGSNRRQLTSLPEHTGAWEPKWSPDGQRIVFHGGDGNLGDIYVVDIDGSELQQLTDVGDANLAPLWLPLSLDDLYIPSADEIVPTATPTPKPVAAAPRPTPVAPPNCPAPGVQITSPAPGTVFTQRNNFIVGTANIVQFHHWKIEYSTNPGGGWQYLLERDYPVENDKLIMLDARTVPRGPYGLRLTVVDQSGNYPEPCEVWYVNGF